MRTIYLDFNSTTPVAPSVREAMLPYLGEFYGDPGSSHWLGRACHEAIEDARSHVGVLLGCHPAEVIFTSGGTESINLGLLGAAMQIEAQLPASSGKHLIISAFEHPVVAKCAESLQSRGWHVTLVGCSPEGVIRLDELDAAFRPDTRLVSIIHANHEIGTVQPIREVSDLAHQHGALVHTDAVQSVGRIRTSVDELGVDLLSLSGHKMYAPKGIGALYVRTGTRLQSILFGEGQESGLRPGTENVSHIVGLGHAARMASLAIQDAADRMAELRDRLQASLERARIKGLFVHAQHAERLPNTLSVAMVGCSAADLARRVPEVCFGFSSVNGTSNHGSMSPTLAAMGLSSQVAKSTFRLSLGWTTSEEDIERAANALAAGAEQAE